MAHQSRVRSLHIILYFALIIIAAVAVRGEARTAVVNKGTTHIMSDEEFEHLESAYPFAFAGRQQRMLKQSVILDCGSQEQLGSEGARFALQYQEESESLGRLESAYLRRNRKRHLESQIVPASVFSQRRSN
jgi:hypothetical protein